MAGSGLKLKRGCKVCDKIKGNAKLVKRIYASNAYQKGGESLLKLAEDEDLRYDALRNHTKKHQALSADKLAEAQIKTIEKRVTDRAIQKMVRTGDARQDVVDKLHAMLDTINPDELSGRDVVALLLKATKDTDDVAAKAKDQDIDIMKMMGAVRSGEIIDAVDYELFDPFTVQVEAIEGEIVNSERRVT